MNPDFIFGKNAYYYNREVEAEKILRLVNCYTQKMILICFTRVF